MHGAAVKIMPLLF